MAVVMYEDRPDALVGLQLAALSLARHSPDLPLLAITPGAPDWFLAWAGKIPSLTVRADRDGIVGEVWNVKPSVLLATLDAGYDEAVWFDTDIIATGDFQARLSEADPDAVVGTEEYYWAHQQGSDLMTTGLGMRSVRTFPATINTCVLRINSSHRGLIEEWSRILASPAYLAALKLGPRERPLHYHSDLYVLTGLLGGAEYGDIPVDQLRRGSEIAQCYGPSGFTVRERLSLGRRLPLLIHAMGNKPWTPPPRAEGSLLRRARRAFEATHQDLTPFVAVAREYRGQFDGDEGWLEPRTRVGAAMVRLFPNRPAWQELPLTTVDSWQRGLRSALGIGRMGSKFRPDADPAAVV